MQQRRLSTAALLLAGGVALAGCGGALEDNSQYQLGVPYRAQERFDYCVPASILMWRLYDGLPAVSQSSIANALGGTPCNPNVVPTGVNSFTQTTDTYLDLVYSPTVTQRDQIVARQITSIDRSTPVIPVVRPSKNHVGVINGGKYSDKGTYWEWEFVYFHDPAEYDNVYFAAGDWLEFFCTPGSAYCAQTISSWASAGWDSNFITYDDSVSVYGGGGGCRPIDCGPPEY